MNDTKERFEKFMNDIDNEFQRQLDNASENVPNFAKPETASYATIEEYKAATGKRFRMTKDQKNRGISRDEAFAEFLSNQSN